MGNETDRMRFSAAREGANMELRTLRYFLAVAREENMTEAANVLHVTSRCGWCSTLLRNCIVTIPV